MICCRDREVGSHKGAISGAERGQSRKAEHDDPRLEEFTVVTAEYNVGSLTGVIGVIGPTRMPYEKVISLVSHTSRLLNDLLQQ